ncbi:MAG: hypothetical protein AABX54_03635 [Nanoarchaeota archaeon]
MIQKITKNKKANIPITLLVLMTLVLTVYALYSFNTHMNKVSAEIKDSRFLDYIYARENEINFYVSDMIEMAALKSSEDKSLFIDNFRKELFKYKKNESFIFEELNQVEAQINNENVEMNDKEVSINLSIKIEKKFQDKFIISYLYKKKFVKNF